MQCPTRVALDAFGDPNERDPTNPFVRLLWERGTLFEREIIAKLDQPFTDLSEFKGEEKERLTLEAMRRGDALIYGGRISADDLIGIPDLLRKEVGGYIPGDIKSGAGEEGGGEDGDGKPKLHFAVQLALYVDILERLGLSAGRRALVWDVTRVKELQTEAAQNTKITIKSLVRESEQVRELAVAAGQLSAANAAIVNKAKLSGLWVDRSEVCAVNDISRMSKQQLNDYIRHRYGEHAEELIAWLEKQAKD